MVHLFDSDSVTIDEIEEAHDMFPRLLEQVSMERSGKSLLLRGKFRNRGVKGTISRGNRGLGVGLSITPFLDTFFIGLVAGIAIMIALIALPILTGPATAALLLLNPTYMIPLLLIPVTLTLIIFVALGFKGFLNQRNFLPDMLRVLVGLYRIHQRQRLDVTCTFHKRKSTTGGAISLVILLFIAVWLVFAPVLFPLMRWILIGVAAFLALITVVLLLPNSPSIILDREGIRVHGRTYNWLDLSVQTRHRSHRSVQLVFRSTQRQRYVSRAAMGDYKDLQLIGHLIEQAMAIAGRPIQLKWEKHKLRPLRSLETRYIGVKL